MEICMMARTNSYFWITRELSWNLSESRSVLRDLQMPENFRGIKFANITRHLDFERASRWPRVNHSNTTNYLILGQKIYTFFYKSIWNRLEWFATFEKHRKGYSSNLFDIVRLFWYRVVLLSIWIAFNDLNCIVLDFESAPLSLGYFVGLITRLRILKL